MIFLARCPEKPQKKFQKTTEFLLSNDNVWTLYQHHVPHLSVCFVLWKEVDLQGTKSGGIWDVNWTHAYLEIELLIRAASLAMPDVLICKK